MKYYIIAGEASGDLHASNLMKALILKDADASFRAWGGDQMQKQGAHLVKHYKDLAFMGFIEVLFNIRTIWKNINFCKKDIREYRPDVVILVDYPGFNLRIAAFVKSIGIPVAYYISPQVWAWKQSRVFKIKKVVDCMICVLPFEKNFYKQYDFEVHYVGHPLLDIADIDKKENNDNDKEATDAAAQLPLIGLVPGSRRQEISRMLPLMIRACEHLHGYRFVVAAVRSVPEDFYKSIQGDFLCELRFDAMDYICHHAVAAMITSGTASLQAALNGLPHLVCYKGNILSYWIAKRLVKIKYITLTNLILDRPAIKEFIQNELTVPNMVQEMHRLLSDNEHRLALKQSFDDLRNKLGGSGASERAATVILNMIKTV